MVCLLQHILITSVITLVVSHLYHLLYVRIQERVSLNKSVYTWVHIHTYTQVYTNKEHKIQEKKKFQIKERAFSTFETEECRELINNRTSNAEA